MSKTGTFKRPTNQPHRPIFDKHQQIEVTRYEGGKQVKKQEEYIQVGRATTLINKVKRFFAKLFSPKLRSLDLRSDWARDPSRSDGAKQLRGLWPALGAMVSTRDGRKV